MTIPKGIDFIYGTGQPSHNNQGIEETVEEQDQNVPQVKEDPEEEDVKGKTALKGLPAFNGRISVYVKVTEEMINNVGQFEAELLSDREREMLFAFSKLKYAARYTLMRLAFRKPGLWHPRSAMQRFIQEIGEENLNEALVALCDPVAEIIRKAAPTGVNADEAIDLTGDSDDEEDLPVPTPDLTSTDDPLDTKELSLDRFAQGQEEMALEEILKRLKKDRLREICKDFKCRPPKNAKHADLVSTLLSHAGTQSSIMSFASPGNSKKPNKPRQSTLHNFVAGSSKNLLDRLKAVAAKKLGPCLRVNTDFLLLLRRLQVIYYRSTEHLPSLLLPSLLTHFKKRVYPPYTHARSSIWANREEFLKYERALDILEMIEKITSDKAEAERARTRGMTEATERAQPQKLATPAPPARGCSVGVKFEPMETPLKTPGFCVKPEPMDDSEMETPLKTPGPSVKSELKAEVKDDDWSLEGDTSMDDDLDLQDHEIPVKAQISLFEIMAKAAVDGEKEDAEKEISETAKQSRKQARMLMAVYDEVVKDMWDEAVREEGMKMERPGPALERFQAGHVLTRIVGKVVPALATLKEHEREAELLDALIAQRFWRRGKRAEWYERRALVGQNYVHKSAKGLRCVRQGIIEALQDTDTHLISRPALFRRLQKVENKLKIPEVDRTQSEGELEEANEVWVKATRIWVSKKDLEEKEKEKDLKEKGKGKENQNASGVKGVSKPAKPEWRWTGKSLWKGRTPDEEVNVETAALYHYEDEGFRGFHSETSILTTLFALLFWDVIFADVPGAFETGYQIAPLDLIEDSFYRARKEIIDKRLEEIEDGKAREILEKHYEMYKGNEGGKKETWCVGMRWDVATKGDLGEIVECMGGETLVHICKLFCEDYAARTSGVPDLIVWNYESKESRFVEVKGPNDRASASQRLWFDTLLRAGTAVDLCHVEDSNAPPKQAAKKKGKRVQPAVDSDEDHSGDEWQPRGSRKRSHPHDNNEDEEAVLIASQDRMSTPQAPEPEVIVVSPSMVRKRRKIIYLN
ncbi:hypothetical protein D9758_000974 [Tetrapyrgos nigripes]|uniref:Fanconi-associated nuclease n=1 Tax=Tetrapyrgos nigripes TaxID=182062 RepID=A0A8H5GZA2_9AGAR|nr:hypothetical protein D9758_000974 [Tetrapyrgos nigripes]